VQPLPSLRSGTCHPGNQDTTVWSYQQTGAPHGLVENLVFTCSQVSAKKRISPTTHLNQEAASPGFFPRANGGDNPSTAPSLTHFQCWNSVVPAQTSSLPQFLSANHFRSRRGFSGVPRTFPQSAQKPCADSIEPRTPLIFTDLAWFGVVSLLQIDHTRIASRYYQKASYV
jgi:hypothetical protein